MAQQECTYRDRTSVLVAYLYDDIDTVDRVAFEAHVAGCEPCRTELAEFRGVRSMLAEWATPQPTRGAQPVANVPTRWWQSVPAWAQVAAAMLVLGISAAIANLDVRYTHANGLTIRTGWSKPAPAQVSTPLDANAAPWRADLAALQQQLRGEIRAQSATLAASATAPASAISDAEFRRRVRSLLDESEQKQKKDFALQLVQLQQDVYAQRQADLSRL